MRKLILGLALAATSLATVAQQMSMAVPGAVDNGGRKVLTFIAKDPPGQRCNGNLQVAAELANVYRVPIQLLPSSLAPGLPAPAVFFGNQLIAADGRDHNGQASFQMVADVLEIEGVARQDKAGLLSNDKVRKDFEALRATINSGGK
jgi:hypothetical protein